MNNPQLQDIWVYLSASPLLGLTITLVVYGLAYRIYLYANSNPLLNPVAISVATLIIFLVIADIPYQDYFDGAQFVHFLLGPATVALAIPLYQQIDRLKALWLPILLTVICGVSLAALSAILIGRLFGGSEVTLLSLSPKSVTAPVAMGIAEKIGGLPSLTAALVVSTGILGAVIGTKLFDWMGVKDDTVRGIAMGVTAHGIGTARAFQVSAEMGAFSGLAMALSAFVTSVILPWLIPLFGFAL